MGTFGGAQPIVTNGLVFAIDAANYQSYPGSGTTWSDMVGGNDGTLTNGPTFNEANGGNIVFDGSDDYVDFGTQSNLSNITNISVTSWVYPIGIQSQNVNTIVNRYYNNTPHNGWQLNYRQATENNNIQFTWGGREDSSEFLSTDTLYSFNLNNWYFICGTKEGNLWKIYVNGELEVSQNTGVGTTFFTSNKIYLGAFPQFNYFTNSKIPITHIYNRALTAQEISQNYNALKSRFGL